MTVRKTDILFKRVLLNSCIRSSGLPVGSHSSGLAGSEKWKALHHIDLNLVSHGYVSGVSLHFRSLATPRSLLHLSLLIDRGEDYFSHKTVNRPFRFILLTSCLIRNGF